MLKNTIWRIALIPSVYSIAVWVALLFLLSLKIINVNISITACAIYGYTILCFILSAFINYHLASEIVVWNISGNIKYNAIDKGMLILFVIVGSYGVYKYILDFTQLLGGESFFLIFFINPLRIRELAAEETSIGFQLSYFTWPILPYCLLLLKKSSNSISKRLVLIVGIVLCFFANLLFIDRTRPVLLLITGVLTYMIIFNNKIKNPLRILLIVAVGPMVIFFGQALFTSKYDSGDGIFNNFLVYLLGSFGYFSEALDDQVRGFTLENTLMPAYKILSMIGFISPPPPQILEFKNIPFATNVGTFLQPLVADGGWLFVVFLMPMLVFFLDKIALSALKNNKLFGIFIWSNIVAASLLSFFVPKYNSTYFYLFLLIHWLVIALNSFLKRKNISKTN